VLGNVNISDMSTVWKKLLGLGILLTDKAKILQTLRQKESHSRYWRLAEKKAAVHCCLFSFNEKDRKKG